MLNSYRQIDVNEYNKRVSIPSCNRVETIQAYSILDEAFIASIAKETIDDSYFAIISKNLVEDNKYKAVWISDFFDDMKAAEEKLDCELYKLQDLYDASLGKISSIYFQNPFIFNDVKLKSYGYVTTNS